MNVSKVIEIRHDRKKGLLKEVTRLSYLDSTTPLVIAPVAEVLFILTANPSPQWDRLGRAVIPIPWSSIASTEGILKPYLDFGVYC